LLKIWLLCTSKCADNPLFFCIFKIDQIINDHEWTTNNVLLFSDEIASKPCNHKIIVIEIKRKETIKCISIFMSSLIAWLLPGKVKSDQHKITTYNNLLWLHGLDAISSLNNKTLFVVHSWSLIIWSILKIQKNNGLSAHFDVHNNHKIVICCNFVLIGFNFTWQQSSY
jgi:hypothetical protein